MKKKENKKDTSTNLLKKALKLAAVEAYQTEIIDTSSTNSMFGIELPLRNEWINDKIEGWLDEAELTISPLD